jgi:DNA-directed RNA polymerase III subunit RPC1
LVYLYDPANQGFSIGIDDVQPGVFLNQQKSQVIEKGYIDCDNIIKLSKSGKLPNSPGCNQEKTLEGKLSGILSRIRDDLGQVCFQELGRHNAPLLMSLCGSKGSKINVAQMVACVGQQIISGERIPDGFGDRSLPHFPKNGNFMFNNSQDSSSQGICRKQLLLWADTH